MNQTDARRALLLRAFEQPVVSAPWTAEDGEAVSRLALRQLGEQAGAAPFIAERARLGVERLSPREPAVDAALAATGDHRGLGRAIVVLAALAGALADAVGSAQRINILAPPLFALLIWNLVVYATLAVAAARRVRIAPAAVAGARPRRNTAVASTSPATTAPTAAGLAGRRVDGPLRRVLAQGLCRLVQRAVSLPAGSTATAPVARFVGDWWQHGAPLNAARLAGMLHAAAAAFALAAIASLYVRGLGFEYRAGWDSTFLTTESVHSLLSLLFAPALAITGTALPDVDALTRLRFSTGPGENAARWIHLQALTIALFVVLPRAALAAMAARRARRLAHDSALPLEDAYFARLAGLPAGRSLTVHVLPYSYQLPGGALPALTGALERLHQGAVGVQLAPTVPLGGEDDPSTWSAALTGSESVAVLFASTATPERENHGAFVAAVSARLAARTTPGVRPLADWHREADDAARRTGGAVDVLVDESAFRRRFTGADGAARREQRREAWRRLLAEQGAAPHFVDLSSPGAAMAPPPADSRIEPLSGG